MVGSQEVVLPTSRDPGSTASPAWNSTLTAATGGMKSPLPGLMTAPVTGSSTGNMSTLMLFRPGLMTLPSAAVITLPVNGSVPRNDHDGLVPARWFTSPTSSHFVTATLTGVISAAGVFTTSDPGRMKMLVPT